MFSVVKEFDGNNLIYESEAGIRQYDELTKHVPSKTTCPICGLPAEMNPRSIVKYIKSFKCLAGHEFYYDDNANICNGDGYNVQGQFIADNPNIKSE